MLREAKWEAWGLVLAGCVFAIAAQAGADIFCPPPWITNPPGQGTTTHQEWEFGTAANPTPPDVDNNQFGVPLATVENLGPSTYWKDLDEGHQGVWRLYGDGDLKLDIPNSPTPNAVKEIWLQITFSAAKGHDPEVRTTPELTGNVELVWKSQIDATYYHGVYKARIEPNPVSETIYLMPRDCIVYFDEVVVDTICIPEPATLGLLVLGGLGMVRSRRR